MCSDMDDMDRWDGRGSRFCISRPLVVVTLSGVARRGAALTGGGRAGSREPSRAGLFVHLLCNEFVSALHAIDIPGGRSLPRVTVTGARFGRAASLRWPGYDLCPIMSR